MSIYKSLPSTNQVFISHPTSSAPAHSRHNTLRYVFFAVFAFFFAGTLSFLATKHPTNSAATVTGFNPGNIINDYTMGNYNSMTESEIQAFLTAKNPCSNTNYATYQYLVQHYNEELGKPTSTHSWHFADGHFVCLSEELFGEGTAIGVEDGETAAHIIWQAAQDYQINPQVLIVLLEKEQGLISDSIPRSGQYRSATGYGCPDTAACDAKYYGFKNQIRNAAALFRTALNGESSYYPIGNNYVLYNPNSSCGGSWVNIENLATGVLYRYTPYQPNSAALAAGTGYGNACSAYGNRNFYHYFTEWFGSTQTTPPEEEPPVIENTISAKYNAINQADPNALGSPVKDIEYNPSTGIYYQEYQNGFIVGTDALGYYESRGGIRKVWQASNFEYGKFGFPLSDIEYNSKTGIYYQNYQNGVIVGNDKLGYYESRGGIRKVWEASGFESGPLGFPVKDIEYNPSTGIYYQEYQNGFIVGTDALGYYISMGAIRDFWKQNNFEYGRFGFPLSNITTSNGISSQKYQYGTIYTDGTNTWAK